MRLRRRLRQHWIVASSVMEKMGAMMERREVEAWRVRSGDEIRRLRCQTVMSRRRRLGRSDREARRLGAGGSGCSHITSVIVLFDRKAKSVNE